MSEQNQPEVAPEANASNDNDLKAQLAKVMATNERLLSESKTNKTKRSEFEELQKNYDALVNKELEAKGNWQELLSKSEEKNRGLELQINEQNNKILKGNIVNAVSKAAKDAHDVGDLLAQSDFTKMIEVNDETLEPTKESVELFVNSLKEEKKYLFKGGKVAAMADAKPSINTPTEKTFKQMSAAERLETMKESFTVLAQPRG